MYTCPPDVSTTTEPNRTQLRVHGWDDITPRERICVVGRERRGVCVPQLVAIETGMIDQVLNTSSFKHGRSRVRKQDVEQIQTRTFEGAQTIRSAGASTGFLSLALSQSASFLESL